MVTSKDQPTTAKKTAPKATSVSYSEQAAALAAGTRALVENVREDLNKLTEQVTTLNDTEPGTGDALTAYGVRRIPMAIGEVTRALAALDLTGADLARAAAL